MNEKWTNVIELTKTEFKKQYLKPVA
jgi:hypothetical protein